MREAGLKASSVNCHLCSINVRINAYLIAWEARFASPSKVEEWLSETFEPEDISRFLSWKPQSKTGQSQLLMLTLADTGLRLGEALNLRWKDVDLDNCLLTVLRKGRKERKVPFSIELRKALYKSIPRSVRSLFSGHPLVPS
jgi:integrase/recombinase XerD